jgi:hypothetical protein
MNIHTRLQAHTAATRVHGIDETSQPSPHIPAGIAAGIVDTSRTRTNCKDAERIGEFQLLKMTTSSYTRTATIIAARATGTTIRKLPIWNIAFLRAADSSGTDEIDAPVE